MAIADSYIIYYCPDPYCEYWSTEPHTCYLEHVEGIALDLVELEVFPDGEVFKEALEGRMTYDLDSTLEERLEGQFDFGESELYYKLKDKKTMEMVEDFMDKIKGFSID